MKKTDIDNLNIYINDARAYIREKWSLDIESLYLEFKRYSFVHYKKEYYCFSDVILYMYSNGLSKDQGYFLKDIAKRFYDISMDYNLLLMYLCGYKTIKKNRYYRKDIRTPFRLKQKYQKPKKEQKRKTEREREKESIYKYRNRKKTHENYNKMYKCDYARKEGCRLSSNQILKKYI